MTKPSTVHHSQRFWASPLCLPSGLDDILHTKRSTDDEDWFGYTRIQSRLPFPKLTWTSASRTFQWLHWSITEAAFFFFFFTHDDLYYQINGSRWHRSFWHLLSYSSIPKVVSITGVKWSVDPSKRSELTCGHFRAIFEVKNQSCHHPFRFKS